MSGTRAERASIPRRSFGVQEPALDDDGETSSTNLAQRLLGRISFGNSQHRPSFTFRGRTPSAGGLESTQGIPPDRPPIPTMMQSSGEVYTTPLPTLSMIVLSIVRSVILHRAVE